MQTKQLMVQSLQSAVFQATGRSYRFTDASRKVECLLQESGTALTETVSDESDIRAKVSMIVHRTLASDE